MTYVRTICLLSLWPIAAIAEDSKADADFLEPRLVHLRSGAVREWSEFPSTPQSAQLDVRFSSKRNSNESVLRLRQQDVKQSWRILLNDKQLGELVGDENDMAVCFPIPPETLIDGDNLLRVEPRSRNDSQSDDIRVGEIRIEPRAMRDVLNEGIVEITVLDADRNMPLPCRLTILNREGALQTTGAISNEQLAVRPGTIYSARGEAHFGLPVGKYTIYAGRGFEYSLARAQIDVTAGTTVRQTLSIRREVPTDGYVACDTHVHTLTHSGHGDATITERMITLAGEGIELPIATDHNVHIDYESIAQQLNVRRHFTPVIGNEVTTSVGHFNVFPISAEARVPDHRKKEWGAIFDEIFQTAGVRVAILNHARDLHSGVRPFGPKLHNAVIGDNLHGWPMRFNAMEVVNSSAVQTDDLRLFHDWMGLLNRGYAVTPVGSSDSHDVARHFVGQGRTYIRCDDHDPGKLDVNSAVTNFLQGRVLVSYGLIAELTVAGDYRSGDLVLLPANPIPEDTLSVDLRVLGPHWTQATRVLLFSNGALLREEELPVNRKDAMPRGVHWQGTWKLPRPRHDVHLVAIALGPGIRDPFWKTARPYQPTSPDWHSQIIGCSGAVWLDGDHDGRRSTARDYAAQAFATAKGALGALLAALAPYDTATAAQAAHLYRVSGGMLDSDELNRALNDSQPAVRAGFRSYIEAWRACELAQAQP